MVFLMPDRTTGSGLIETCRYCWGWGEKPGVDEGDRESSRVDLENNAMRPLRVGAALRTRETSF